ncbi:hypothetical protein V5O48_016790 [Marasmius crinis-equi]|uniref:Uncharacterized protein n=1 Tax=Marasmius crinis-equi TaxID=585013 RepID=A0ABR3EQX5_9AGAR
MAGRQAVYIPLPVDWFPSNPPLELSVFSDLEKAVIRKELKEKIVQTIERLARTQPVRNRRIGGGHRWSGWKISLGVYNWRNVGRIYRKCHSLYCWKSRKPCIRVGRYMTRAFDPRVLEELNDLRAFYDALGAHWSDSIVGSDDEERTRWVRFMWQERELPTVEALWQIYFRHLDVQEIADSEGVDTDSTDSDEDPGEKVEPDSDEDADWFAQMVPEDSDEEMTESRTEAGGRVKQEAE